MKTYWMQASINLPANPENAFFHANTAKMSDQTIAEYYLPKSTLIEFQFCCSFLFCLEED